MRSRKLLQQITNSQSNVRFNDLLKLAKTLGFVLDRVSGSHHILIHREHPEAQLNLQPKGKQAAPYQVRQLLKLVEQYNLRIHGEED